MAKIPLRQYNREIESLIDHGKSEEAIAHCKLILQSYPKYIETYRLLGKALLESHRFEEAADIFQRILSSIPDDFVSQLGLSIIREDEGNLDAAIWHMERAYEVQSANSAVQGELRRLYGRRDGLEPTKIHMTRGALIRMYAKGNLFQQAIAEIRAAQKEDPNRPDLQVILAGMYYQAGQKVEAADICSTLLPRYPYCLEANRILTNILPGTSRAEDAQTYQQRLVAMDPYIAAQTTGMLTPSEVPDQAVLIEHLEWNPLQSETPVQPKWASSLGVNLEAEQSDQIPDWLIPSTQNSQYEFPSEIADKQTSSAAFLESTAQQSAIPSSVTDAAGNELIPDWMRDAGWTPSTGEFTEGPTDQFQAAEFPWEQTTEEPYVEEAPAIPAEYIPEWMLEIEHNKQPKDASSDQIIGGSESFTPFAQTSSEAQPSADINEPAPDWLLNNFGQGTSVETSGVAGEQINPLESGDVPDWLKNLTTPSDRLASQVEEETSESSFEQGLLSFEELSSVTSSVKNEAPDFGTENQTSDTLDELKDSNDYSSYTSVQPDETSLPSWLRAIDRETQDSPATTPEPSELPPSAEPVPTWMSVISHSDQPKPDQENLETPTVDETAFEDISWLKGLTPGQEESTPVSNNTDSLADVPDWLKGISDSAEPSSPLSLSDETTGISPALNEIPPFETANDSEVSRQEWFDELANTHLSEAKTESVSAISSLTPPEWLFEQDSQEKQDVPAEQTAPPSAEEVFEPSDSGTEIPKPEASVPDWVSDLRGENPEDISGSSTSDLPDWLLDFSKPSGGTSEMEPKPESAPESIPTLETPDWLFNTPSFPTTPPESQLQAPEAVPADTSLPDWLFNIPDTSNLGTKDLSTKVTSELSQPTDITPSEISPEEPVPATPEVEPVEVVESAPAVELFTPVTIEPPTAVETPSIGTAEPLPAVESPASDIFGTSSTLGETPPVEATAAAPVEPPELMTSVEIPEPEAQSEPQVQSGIIPPVEEMIDQQPPQSFQPDEIAAGGDDLAAARSYLDHGEISKAVEIYTDVLSRGEHLEELIQDLRAATASYPEEELIWEKLGDVYAHTNRLQEALDSYTKAEELLK